MLKRFIRWVHLQQEKDRRRGLQKLNMPTRGRVYARVYRAKTDTWEDLGEIAEVIVDGDRLN